MTVSVMVIWLLSPLAAWAFTYMVYVPASGPLFSWRRVKVAFVSAPALKLAAIVAGTFDVVHVTGPVAPCRSALRSNVV